MEQKIYQVCHNCKGTGDFKGKICQDCEGEGRVLFGFLIQDEPKKKEPEKKEGKKAY